MYTGTWVLEPIAGGWVCGGGHRAETSPCMTYLGSTRLTARASQQYLAACIVASVA